METQKQQALRIIGGMGDEGPLEKFAYTLWLQAKIDRAEAQCDAGDVLSQDDAEREIEEWLASRGPVKPEMTSAV